MSDEEDKYKLGKKKQKISIYSPSPAAGFSPTAGLAVVRRTSPLFIRFTFDHYTTLDIKGTKKDPTPIKLKDSGGQIYDCLSSSSLEVILVE